MRGLFKIDYRCPQCRNCQACRDAHGTERISLREEAEEAIIKDAVKLDYENKRFICTLPLRGKPEDFLTTNKHEAAKILEKQVRLYHKEEDTAKLIVKAMDMLGTLDTIEKDYTDDAETAKPAGMPTTLREYPYGRKPKKPSSRMP